MEISRIQPSVQPAELPFEKVAASGQLSEADKIAEASRQFEAMLLRKILSEAQKPMFNSPLMPTGTSSAIYQDMVTNELADQISRGGSFGLAQLLQKEFTPTKQNNEQAASAAGQPAGC